jgi:hypothetical protein
MSNQLSSEAFDDVFDGPADDIDRIWAVEYTAVGGQRMIEVPGGTEDAAHYRARDLATADPVLLVYGAHLISRINGG